MRVITLAHTNILSLHSNFLQPFHQNLPNNLNNSKLPRNNNVPKSITITCSTSSPIKSRRDPSLDKHVTKSNKLRFVQKLTTLLLSKPKQYMRIHILSKCKSYLCLSKRVSIIYMIHRYPAIFELFYIPTPQKPANATRPLSQLCVRFTPAAEALVCKEIRLKNEMRDSLAMKLQKLLMMASHHRLLLSKIVHLGPDLGLPVNFRSRLCNEYADKFKIVDTSYGRALELVTWDENLANVLPSVVDGAAARGLIVERPLKFKQLRLRKGYNVKRTHQEYLHKFKEFPDVCPYRTKVEEIPKEAIEAEKRACAVVREVLAMTVEKRTLVDHLTHFRKEFGLPNKLRAMLVRHPDLFYVSLKGQRDSVFLVEGYDDKGNLLEKDGTLVIKQRLMELVREGKQMRREHRKQYSEPVPVMGNVSEWEDEDDSDGDYHDDDLEELFYSDDFNSEDDSVLSHGHVMGELWTARSASQLENEDTKVPEPW